MSTPNKLINYTRQTAKSHEYTQLLAVLRTLVGERDPEPRRHVIIEIVCLPAFVGSPGFIIKRN